MGGSYLDKSFLGNNCCFASTHSRYITQSHRVEQQRHKMVHLAAAQQQPVTTSPSEPHGHAAGARYERFSARLAASASLDAAHLKVVQPEQRLHLRQALHLHQLESAIARTHEHTHNS